MGAYIRKFIQYRFLLVELVKKGIKLKYRRSYLGIIWSLLEPLLTMIVLTIVFGTLLGNHTKEFPVYILCGRLLYSYFNTATKGCVKSIRQNSAMIKKVYVPKYLYPLSKIIYEFVIFAISLIVLVVVALVLGVYPTLRVFWVVPVLAVMLLLTFGIGMILSTIGVFFRDMEYIWNVAGMLIMYTCAIFYEPDRILASNVGIILKANPLFCLIQCFRAAVFGNEMNMHYLLYALAFSVVASLVGVFIFYKKQDDFILNI